MTLRRHQDIVIVLTAHLLVQSSPTLLAEREKLYSSGLLCFKSIKHHINNDLHQGSSCLSAVLFCEEELISFSWGQHHRMDIYTELYVSASHCWNVRQKKNSPGTEDIWFLWGGPDNHSHASMLVPVWLLEST